ncbi:MAG: bifunctional oligoribonuclease/PAP phosphatase NrnA [Oscillospiraceae bacterium]|nr:bifunctional oligoribonuclease/PAP phosphatase NrnA [Oscillospiraceae bacterium]
MMNLTTKLDHKQAAGLLLQGDNFVIICHASPDGDTLGGAYALCGALQKLQKTARVITPEKPSPRFDYLKNALVETAEIDTENEIIITVDVADKTLLGDCEKTHGDRVLLCIDHHVSNTEYAQNLLLESESSSACEVVFELIKKLSEIAGKNLMNTDIAACLYTGLSTDTGCFKFSNTNAASHRHAAELFEYGFDSANLNYLLFEMRTPERLNLERQALESVEYFFGGKCAIITLSAVMMEGADEEDLNAISSVPRQIDGVELGVTLKEKAAGIWKISLRSNSYVNSQKICAALGGGGHKRAAGCRIKGTVEECKVRILDEIGKHILDK